MKLIKHLPISFFILSLSTLVACSNNKTTANTSTTTNSVATSSIKNMQKVESGKIVSVKTIAVKPETINSYGNVGVSVGSGGYGGVYGSVDMATIGKIFRNATKPSTEQQFIITKSNGETVAITQPTSKEIFRIGDTVKILLENGKAKVLH